MKISDKTPGDNKLQLLYIKRDLLIFGAHCYVTIFEVIFFWWAELLSNEKKHKIKFSKVVTQKRRITIHGKWTRMDKSEKDLNLFDLFVTHLLQTNLCCSCHSSFTERWPWLWLFNPQSCCGYLNTHAFTSFSNFPSTQNLISSVVIW